MRAISSTNAGITAGVRCSSPDDHFIAGPHCRMMISSIRHVNGAGSGPTVHAWIIPTPSVEVSAQVEACFTAPDDHFNPRPNRRMITSRLWRINSACCCPAVGVWVIFTASVQVVIGAVIKIASPSDHLATGPHCLGVRSASRRIDYARGDPSIHARIVFAPGCIEKWAPPYDHFTASPDRCVRISGARRTDGGSGCPTVHYRIVVAASI